MLAVAVIAALAGNARTKQVSGDPVRGSLPNPPAVGDCVLEPMPAASFNGSFNGPEGAVEPPAADTAPCTGERYGEVIAVIPDGLDYVAPADGDVWGDQRSPDRQCSAAADVYLGIDGDAYGPGRWFPMTSVEMARIGPGPVLAGAGQRWLACTLGASSMSNGTPSARPYSLTLRHALSSLQLPPEVAECAPALPGPTGSVEVFSCERPHVAEVLGFASSDRPNAAVKRRLTSECPGLIRSLTRLADPAADSRLQISVSSVQLPPDSSDSDRDAVGPVYYYCGVEATGGHLLTGPLLGLGGGPLPIR